MKQKIQLLIVLIALVFTSCKKDDDTSAEPGNPTGAASVQKLSLPDIGILTDIVDNGTHTVILSYKDQVPQLTKFDNGGQKIWSRSYADVIGFPTSLIELADRSYVFGTFEDQTQVSFGQHIFGYFYRGGACWKGINQYLIGSDSLPEYAPKYRTHVIRVSGQGEKIWTNELAHGVKQNSLSADDNAIYLSTSQDVQGLVIDNRFGPNYPVITNTQFDGKIGYYQLNKASGTVMSQQLLDSTNTIGMKAPSFNEFLSLTITDNGVPIMAHEYGYVKVDQGASFSFSGPFVVCEDVQDLTITGTASSAGNSFYTVGTYITNDSLETKMEYIAEISANGSVIWKNEKQQYGGLSFITSTSDGQGFYKINEEGIVERYNQEGSLSWQEETGNYLENRCITGNPKGVTFLGRGQREFFLVRILDK